MAKTEAEVIAKLQRRLENTGRHIVGMIDHLEGAKKDAKRMEDTLVWIHKRMTSGSFVPLEITQIIESKIPTRLRREQEKNTTEGSTT